MCLIDRVIVVNLDRRVDKYCAWLGAARVMYLPPERTYRFSAFDGLDFNSFDEIIDRALVDFPFWQKLRDNREWMAKYAGRGTLACMLSYQSALKMISEVPDKNSLSIFLADHSYVSLDWFVLNHRLKQLPPFDIFQMWSWFSKEYPRPPGYPYRLAADETVSLGLGGAGDVCMLLTPAGAARILDWWSDSPYHLMEIVLHERSYLPLREQSGCLSAVRSFQWAGCPIILTNYGVNAIDSERLHLDALGFPEGG